MNNHTDGQKRYLFRLKTMKIRVLKEQCISISTSIIKFEIKFSSIIINE